MPATPKKQSSAQRQSPAIVTKARSGVKSTNSATTLYLVLYNTAAALGWAFVLTSLLQHLSRGGWDGTIKGAFGLESAQDKLLQKAATSYADFGNVVKYVQTMALLETVHAALGLVRSSVGTTIAQVASRIFMVWYICPFYPQVAASPWYSSMVFAWSTTEIIRYSHYVVSLLNTKLALLEWLRYSTFYVLYPLGAGSEAALIFKSAPYAREHFGPVGFFATVALCALWPPALLVMMNHMHRQRRKYLGKAGAGSSKRVSSATKAKIEAAQAQAHASGTDTPTRITRSRAKAGAV